MHPLEVDTPYVSYGEILSLLTIFTYEWVVCVGGLRHAFWHLAARDGYCVQFVGEVLLFVFTAVDTLAVFYVGRSDNGEQEIWQACMWVSLTVRLFASVPAVAISKGFLGWGIGMLCFVEAGLITSCVLMYLATNPLFNYGPYLGTITPLVYGFMLVFACVVYGNCCSERCCGECCSYKSYDARSKDFAAWEDSRGAHQVSQRLKYGKATSVSEDRASHTHLTKKKPSKEWTGGYRQPGDTSD